MPITLFHRITPGMLAGGIDSPLQRPLLAERLKQTLANIILNEVQATMECVVQRQITLRDNVGGTSAEQLSGLFCPFHCTFIAQKPLWDREQ